MKRVVTLLVALSAAVFVFAQSGEPSEEAVLQKAREKYQNAESEDEPFSSMGKRSGEVPFTPVYLSFVPGLSIPFGYYDVAFSAASIGALTRDVYGFQGAGVFNLSRNIYGFQGGGVFNIAGKVEGFQGAGVFNIADGEVSGFQGAGVFNISEGPVEGGQIAGVFNIAETLRSPVQLAGVFNIAGRVEGTQAAGVFNVGENVSGAQISSVVNVAKRVEGIQLGLVNVAEDLRGLQFGLVNIALNGVNGVGIFYQPQTDYVYGYWQNGSRALYTLLQIGLPREDWFERTERLVLSAGLGSRLSLGGPYIDVDISAAQELGPSLPGLSESLGRGDWDAAMASLPAYPYPSVRLGLGVPILGRLHFVGGVTFDIDLERWPGLPENLKAGADASSHDWFDLRFTSYTKWFLGFRI